MMSNGEPERIQAGVPDEQKLRRYLLGQDLAGESEEIERALLSHAEISDLLSVLEDELTEDYVTGELNDRERGAFERLYLTSEEGRMKIQLSAMLLKRPDFLQRIPLDTVKRACAENWLRYPRGFIVFSDDLPYVRLDTLLREGRQNKARADELRALYGPMGEPRKVPSWRKWIVRTQLLLLRVRGFWNRVASRAR
jgi:hypothetical protein